MLTKWQWQEICAGSSVIRWLNPASCRTFWKIISMGKLHHILHQGLLTRYVHTYNAGCSPWWHFWCLIVVRHCWHLLKMDTTHGRGEGEEIVSCRKILLFIATYSPLLNDLVWILWVNSILTTWWGLGVKVHMILKTFWWRKMSQWKRNWCKMVRSREITIFTASFGNFMISFAIQNSALVKFTGINYQFMYQIRCWCSNYSGSMTWDVNNISWWFRGTTVTTFTANGRHSSGQRQQCTVFEW